MSGQLSAEREERREERREGGRKGGEKKAHWNLRIMARWDQEFCPL